MPICISGPTKSRSSRGEPRPTRSLEEQTGSGPGAARALARSRAARAAGPRAPPRSPARARGARRALSPRARGAPGGSRWARRPTGARTPAWPAATGPCPRCAPRASAPARPGCLRRARRARPVGAPAAAPAAAPGAAAAHEHAGGAGAWPARRPTAPGHRERVRGPAGLGARGGGAAALARSITGRRRVCTAAAARGWGGHAAGRGPEHAARTRDALRVGLEGRRHLLHRAAQLRLALRCARLLLLRRPRDLRARARRPGVGARLRQRMRRMRKRRGGGRCHEARVGPASVRRHARDGDRRMRHPAVLGQLRKA